MAVLEILKYPDPRLRIKAKPVQKFDAALVRIRDDMYETMYESAGIGLAATQVNIHQQIFVMDLSEEHNDPMCIVNPEIIARSGTQIDTEGCLSVAGGIYDKVERSLKVKIKAFNHLGEPIHEMDHLNGILFIDHLSKLKQVRIRAKVTKAQRRA
jgi:peptide deformylase